MTDYPGAVTSFATLVDYVDWVLAAHQNTRANEIVAVQTALGTNPQGNAASLKARLAHSLDDDGYLNFDSATELTIASDAITITQNAHKLQPQSSTADNLSTINGTADGDAGVLYVSDFGTDTITIKHNVGNILCVGGADISLSYGCVNWFSNGTKVFMSGGGAPSVASGGEWVAGTGTWSYVSADAPSFVVNVPDANAALFSVGARFKLTQTTDKFFIVTAKGSPSGGYTPCTIYGGTDYTLANAAITTPFFSGYKAPLGFPTSPLKWTVELTDVTNRSQASPTSGTWYNLGSLTISIPIGCWNVEYFVYAAAARTGTDVNSFVTLSTANNSESDVDFTNASNLSGATGNLFNAGTTYKRKNLLLAAKTSYYINAKVALASTGSVNFYNADSKLFIRAICAYL